MDQSTPTALTVPDLRRFVAGVQDDANARARVTHATDLKMVCVFLTAAVALTLNNFLSDGSLDVSDHRDFNRLSYWALVSIATYVLPAVICIKVVLRERVRDYGLRLAGIASHGRTYLALFALVAPLIIAFSFTAAFQAKYPFYHPAIGESLWPYMYAWWVLYWLQFCALEFFFRGFMVHGLAPRLGWAAVFAMVVPYNMIHYGKPMAEAFAAIAGGIVLGVLSLRTRSIWWGAALHIAIAFTMDLAALHHLGRL
jgi:membrane protease YdiL (CAAX protease family)